MIHGDQTLMAALLQVDEGDAEVTPWEADFLDSIFKQDSFQSDRQREKADQIARKYGAL